MTHPLFRDNALQGETILVTGGGSGLGRAIATSLLELGAHVHICGRREVVLAETAAALRQQTGGRIDTHAADIRDAAAIDAMFDRIWQDAPLTGLVNNAAANFVSPTERLSSRAFDAIANTVFHGTFYVTLAAGKRWIASQSTGSVVSIVNTGVVNGAPFTVPAVMSKAGIAAMTKSLAVEWGHHGIRLNAIGPGLFPTPGAQGRLMPGSSADEQARRNPMKRTGEMAELQSLLVFLLSRECAYLNGQVVMLDGAHHLAHGNLFSPLLELSSGQWDEVSASIRAKDAAEKAQRAAAQQAEVAAKP
jgi:NAD(P)-dependent dehydrogenase (short-subunit alcohol dehydrogenase family)